jgi:hypothetical protein
MRTRRTVTCRDRPCRRLRSKPRVLPRDPMPFAAPTETTSFDHVFVGCLPRGTTELELRAALALVGVDVGTIDLVMDRVTGLPRGFAFVSLRGRIDTLALGRLRCAMLEGRPLEVLGVPRPLARHAR